jgi:hypothetical protein
MTRSSASLGLAALLFGGAALAEPTSSGGSGSPTPANGQRIAVDTPAEQFTAHAGTPSRILYLNRCTGGCVVHGGPINDAKSETSSIPMGAGPFTIGAYNESVTGEWAQLVRCVQEVYSPFNVMVTDVLPTSGTWNEAIVGGVPADLGLGNDILGIAPLAGDCSAQDNAISFSFANAHPPTDHMLNVCWTVSQESAHVYGLDHEFMFTDGAYGGSACNDPMTYRTDCGGEKFFRNHSAACGEYTTRMCRCQGYQNSHLKILSVFGPGTPITTPPTSMILDPAANATIGNGATIHVAAGAQRGIDHLDLYLNGFKWGMSTPGATFEAEGQPVPPSPGATYGITIPADVPDSIIDIVVKAYDDLGTETDSQTVTVTKNMPCTDATACATGQQCAAGKCFWNTPTGEIGDKCSYDQFCTSMECSPTKTDRICTQTCVPGSMDSCPSGYQCLMNGPSGFCYFPSGGGCCSAGNESAGAMLAHICFGGLVLGILLRRRRR